MRYAWIFLVVFCVAGCSDADQPSSKRSITFQSDFQRAAKFHELRKKGDVYRDRSDFDNAILTYEQALEVSFSKPDNTVAYERLGMTYESMGDYTHASECYLNASKETLNENRRMDLANKSEELGQKATVE